MPLNKVRLDLGRDKATVIRRADDPQLYDKLFPGPSPECIRKIERYEAAAARAMANLGKIRLG